MKVYVSILPQCKIFVKQGNRKEKCRILPHKQKNDIDFERKLYYNKVQKNYEKTLCLLFDTDSAQNLKEAKKCFTMQF